MKVAHVGTMNLLELIVVHEEAKQVLQIIWKLLFEILKGKNFIRIFLKGRIDIQFNIRTKKRSKALKNSAADVLICLFFKDFLQSVYPHRYAYLFPFRDL